MIVTQGGRFGGYGFYLPKVKPVFLWNMVDLKRVRSEGSEALSPGKHTLESGIGRSGTDVGGTLWLGGPLPRLHRYPP
jgi:arylsulfatase